jgi:hypothetical protein
VAFTVANPVCTYHRVTSNTYVDCVGTPTSLGVCNGVSGQLYAICSTPANIPLVGGYIADATNWHCTRYILPREVQVAKSPVVAEAFVEDRCYQVIFPYVAIHQFDGWDNDRNLHGLNAVALYRTEGPPENMLSDQTILGLTAAANEVVFANASLSDMTAMVANASLIPQQELIAYFDNWLANLHQFGYVRDTGKPFPVKVTPCRSS